MTNLHPLHYETPFNERLPHSELGSLSLSFTGIWLFFIAVTLSTAAIDGWTLGEADVTFALAGFTLMAMGIFIPMGFIVALFAIAEQRCRRTCAYVCAAVNGGVLMVVIFAVGNRF